MFVPLLSEEVVYTGGLDPAGGAIELSCWICPFLTEGAAASSSPRRVDLFLLALPFTSTSHSVTLCFRCMYVKDSYISLENGPLYRHAMRHFRFNRGG